MLARKPWRWRSAAVRAQADRLRRRREFEAAVPLYRHYLTLRPDHATAWMLFGQCLQELGEMAEADQAYANAVRLGPRNRDAHNARAHFLKITGRRQEARNAFVAAIALGAGEQAERELLHLQAPGAHPAGDALPGAARVWIDVSDLLIFLNHNRHVSGIQRVQLVLLEHALAWPQEACCVTTQPWDGRIWCLSPAAIRAFRDLFAASGGGTKAMRAAIRRLLDTASEVAPEPGGPLFQPGAFWIGGGNPPLWRRVRLAGMKLVPLIHDIIPVRAPDVCVPELVREFSWALGEELRSVDAIIANSTHTANDVRGFMAQKGMAAVPVIAVPLAHRLNEAPPAQSVWTKQIAPLREKRFVLTVGTVEPRKNNPLLLRIWQAMVDDGLDPPTLVIAGKRGWLTESFDAEMAWSRAAGKRVMVLSDLSDAEIDTLYSACLFTTFPSFAEGWGLPVGESLARGKICVSSNRDSMPEVGGDAAIYIDPVDEAAAGAVFRRLIFEPGALAAAEAHLRDSFTPRGWPEVVAGIMAGLQGLPDRGPVELTPPVLHRGVVFRTSPVLRGAREDPFGEPLRLMLAEGWLPPGPAGTAMMTCHAPLFLAPAEAGLLRLRLHAMPAVVLEAGGAALTLARDSAGWLEVPVAAGPLRLTISVTAGDPARVPSIEPGIWLTAVELRGVGL